MDDRELKACAARIEALVKEVESFQDAGVRETVVELLQALLQLYGHGLGRMLEIVERRDRRILDHLAQDELVAHLLFLHGLHPVPLELRVAQAVEEVRPYLRSHGGNVELVSIEGGAARLRLHGSCRGCSSSSTSLKAAVEDAIRKAAPELQAIEVENAAESPSPRLTLVAGPAPLRRASDHGRSG